MFCLIQASGASLLYHFFVLLRVPCHLAVTCWIVPAVLTVTSLYFMSQWWLKHKGRCRQQLEVKLAKGTVLASDTNRKVFVSVTHVLFSDSDCRESCRMTSLCLVMHTVLLFQIGSVEVNWEITLDILNHQTILGTILQTQSAPGTLTHHQSAVFWLWFQKYFYQ